MRDKRNMLFDKQQGRCFYCDQPCHNGEQENGGPYDWRAATLEHLKRKTDGGTSGFENLAMCCKLCNNSRGEHTIEEYKSIASDRKRFISEIICKFRKQSKEQILRLFDLKIKNMDSDDHPEIEQLFAYMG